MSDAIAAAVLAAIALRSQSAEGESVAHNDPASSLTATYTGTDKLAPGFRERAEAFLADLRSAGEKVRIMETWRDPERQLYLYGQGRPSEKYGRVGQIVTYVKSSRHTQGKAIDLWPSSFDYFTDGNKSGAFRHILERWEPLANRHGLSSLAAKLQRQGKAPWDFGHFEDLA